VRTKASTRTIAESKETTTTHSASRIEGSDYLLGKPLHSETTIPTWMKSFLNEYKGMIMTNACLFKRLKDHS